MTQIMVSASSFDPLNGTICNIPLGYQIETTIWQMHGDYNDQKTTGIAGQRAAPRRGH